MISVSRTVIVIAALLATCQLATPNTASAEPSGASVNPDYPGLEADGGVLDLSLSEVQAAVSAYQQVFGMLPGSWSDVVDSGLFVKPLLAYDMQTINPDDGRIDFNGDLYLDSTTMRDADGSLLLFHVDRLNGNKAVSRIRIPREGSLEDMFSSMQRNSQLDQAERDMLADWAGDAPLKLQFGHLHILTAALFDYRSVKGVFPASLNELVQAGFGPLAAGSLNPVTGLAYRFDGSPGDIAYSVEDNGNGFSLQHVDLQHPDRNLYLTY
jgi:hypothetical protein